MMREMGPNPKFGKTKPRRRGKSGFVQAAVHLDTSLREVSGRRGIADTRLLTDWVDVVGTEIARLARPIRISHAGSGLGGTLILLAKPGCGPELDMMIPQVIERVNACCGYRAVTRVKLTQTAPSGFGEHAEPFAHRDSRPAPLPTNEDVRAVSGDLTTIEDEGLRVALENMARCVLMKSRTRRR